MFHIRGVAATAVVTLFLLPSPAPAQTTAKPPAGQPAKASQPVQPGPYQTIPVSLAGPVQDPSFEEFRKGLTAIVARKDRTALTGLLDPNFFWLTYQGEQGKTAKSAYDKLAGAIDLPDASGWEFLKSAAEDPSLQPFAQRPGAQCAPAGPIFDYQAFDGLVKSTGTKVSDWAYSDQADLPVRVAEAAKSAVIDTLGLELVRILPAKAGRPTASAGGGAGGEKEAENLRVVTPKGRIGWVTAEHVWRLNFDQLCYAKVGDGWKIVGYLSPGE